MGIELWSEGVNTKDILTKTQVESLSSSYTEISEAEITAGTGTTSRLITGRRVEFLRRTIPTDIVVYLSDNTSTVIAATAVEKLRLPFNYTILSVWFETLYENPTGSSAIVQIKKGSTNIFTSANTLTIPSGSNRVGAFIPNTTSILSTDILNFDITQVGSTTSGKGYRVIMSYQKA